MKLFELIIDDGRDVYKSLCASKNKKSLVDECSGNGEFVRVSDVTQQYFTDESSDKLNRDLTSAGWGEGERKLLCALLESHIISKK